MQCPQYVVCGRSTGGGRRGRFPPSCVNAVGRRPTGRRHTPPCRSADDDVGRRRGSTLRRQRSRGGRWRRMASRQFLASLQDLFYICSVEPKSSRACPTPTASCRTPAATALPPGASRRAGRRPDGGAASRRRRTTACRWPRPARTRPPSRTWATAPSVPKRPASSWIVSISGAEMAPALGGLGRLLRTAACRRPRARANSTAVTDVGDVAHGAETRRKLLDCLDSGADFNGEARGIGPPASRPFAPCFGGRRSAR